MTTEVLIVGGGPSGLTLGLFLANYRIKSIVLEKEQDIVTDPRGVVLTGDALRSLWRLGIGEHVASIGHELHALNFHQTNFQNPPFMVIDLDNDMMEHALPSTILQSQPRLEQALRGMVQSSDYCTFQSSCEVVGRDEDENGVTVRYKAADGNDCEVRTQWLVGADGKRGVVRKHFLEPTAGVKQETGIFDYESTWIAANLHINPPTEMTHPDFALWDLGYDSQAVYDLFWPREWHFCRPPGTPTACGRFGPQADHLWRHEFAVPEWKDHMDAVKTFWKQLTPMITRPITFPDGKTRPVTFPVDCIEILRCRPFHFSHKVVNKWFSGRTALIGDAAHVFPPFGGQGVATGVQDAEALAWRLASIIRIEQSRQISPSSRHTLLQSWSLERRIGIDNAARLTLQNGELCNKEGTWLGTFQIAIANFALNFLRPLGIKLPQMTADAFGYSSCQEGTFLSAAGGGRRLGQIYVQTYLPGSGPVTIELSDKALRRVPTILTLLVINSSNQKEDTDLESILSQYQINSDLLSVKSIVHFNFGKPDPQHCTYEKAVSFPAPLDLLQGYPVRLRYDLHQFQRRLNDHVARYFVLRPDGIIYGKARSLSGLEDCFKNLESNFC
ncbi:hypothetical protein PENANT_c003G03271 [Penicillium antarcticum]|uniref:FAD-binding domain-containing protein n=1 Tax=Penicillium antarcticum TaxID=416450 RepID=A0A1V6QHE5_9EURO|nr:uncharacterized protein N7508_006081 [Penicillium antarcticum]KAJ5307066.1 hypothetical protein N7508_006081 [Penicillium antarcticum]OQD88638.1 hypothetical protein PENANT_c003G03271 [Penicillium antarcticum]